LADRGGHTRHLNATTLPHTLVHDFQVIAFLKLFLIHIKDQTNHHSHWSLQKKIQGKKSNKSLDDSFQNFGSKGSGVILLCMVIGNDLKK
jgi:hypothetical protein